MSALFKCCDLCETIYSRHTDPCLYCKLKKNEIEFNMKQKEERDKMKKCKVSNDSVKDLRKQIDNYTMANQEKVKWIVNDIGELGIEVDGEYFFLYKGNSLIYRNGKHDDGRLMMIRPVGKREFGECCHPVNYKDPTRIGEVSLEDSDEWVEMKPSKHFPDYE